MAGDADEAAAVRPVTRLAKSTPPPTGKEIRITVKLRNNRLIEAREARGWSQAQAAEALGVRAYLICHYETLALSPVSVGYSNRYRTHAGDWKQSALKIAHGYGKPASHFWPEATLAIAHETERVLSTDALALAGGASTHALEAVLSDHPENVIIAGEERSRAMSLLKSLTSMEAIVIRKRHGLDGEDEHTLKEIGVGYNLALWVVTPNVAQCRPGVASCRVLSCRMRRKACECPLSREVGQ